MYLVSEREFWEGVKEYLSLICEYYVKCWIIWNGNVWFMIRDVGGKG